MGGKVWACFLFMFCYHVKRVCHLYYLSFSIYLSVWKHLAASCVNHLSTALSYVALHFLSPPSPTNSPRCIVTIRLHPLPSASHLSARLKTNIFKISASQKFETVVNFVRKKLQVGAAESVFLYVNSVFAPGLDEGVGGLWRVCTFDIFSLRRGERG
jgi:hypothetical protein